MSFTVDTQRLRGLPDLLTRVAQDASVSCAYVLDNADVAWRNDLLGVPAGNLMTYLRPAHERIVNRVSDYLGRAVADTATAGADRVDAALAYYARTDARSAALVDQACHGPEDPAFVAGAAVLPFGSSVSFADTVRPTDRLLEPVAHGERLDYAIDPWFDLLSLAAIIRGAIWFLTQQATEMGLVDRPIDVLEELARPLAGDWLGLTACAEMFRNVAAACDGMGENIAQNQSVVSAVWTGHAADSCREYLMRFDQSLAGAGHQLRRLADHYDKLAADIMMVSQKLGDVLAHLFDMAVETALEVELALSTTEIGIGVAVWALVVRDLWRMYKAVGTATALVEAAEVIVGDFRVVCETLDLFSSPVAPNPLPTLPTLALLPS